MGAAVCLAIICGVFFVFMLPLVIKELVTRTMEEWKERRVWKPRKRKRKFMTYAERKADWDEAFDWRGGSSWN